MKTATTVLLVLLLVSCAGVPRAGWSAGGSELEKGVRILRGSGDDGSGSISIVSPYFGDGVEIRGAVVSPGGDASGGGRFEIELLELRYFANWPRGWTEAVFSVSGSIAISDEGGRWVGSVIEKPEIGEVASARLRYMDGFLGGERAIRAVRNRMERIEAAVAVWREDGCAWFERPTKKKRLFSREKEKSYEETVGPVFFPEIYGYAAGSWKEGPWARGDGRSWDTAYTKSRFPEHLWDVRDTGTLYRDWEEGFPLWYAVSQWPAFWECKFPFAEIATIEKDGDAK